MDITFDWKGYFILDFMNVDENSNKYKFYFINILVFI